ncbi:hypothetical protein [Pedobacter cryoconitis]|uniref:Uncharacterized protein n=1 Tax=Pedobacter cryoconitis TaxID=188932 RepID=A0A7X0MGI7_9SPHI|nr:hypothetical protein [Pedobacter cryoconitis]MBB6498139.1 hypothetical protein [Pedobacter cryoconitis]
MNRVFTKHVPVICLLILSHFTSCKKGERAAEIDEKIIPPVVQPSAKILIPIQLGTGKSGMQISYTADLSIAKIEYGNGTSMLMTYNAAGQPLTLQRYKGAALISSTDYDFNEKGQVIQGSMAVVKGNNYTETGYYTLSYNSLNQPSEINYYDMNDRLTDKLKKSYNEAGNLIGEKGNTEEAKLDYDTKNGLFKHAGYLWLLTLEKEDNLFLSARNNLQQCNFPLKPEKNQTFSYSYNSDNYPETISSTVNGINNTLKVIYKQVKN